MPTLIRLVITLLFLVGLAYGGMIALVAFVHPQPKQVTIRIPARDLLNQSAPNQTAATPPLVAPAPAPVATGVAAEIPPE